jgi:hypothetical protein
MPQLGVLDFVVRFRQPAVLAVAGLCVLTTGLLSAANPDEMRFFEEQVRPILATKCLKCHGAEKQKGGLRLDSPEAVLAGGDSGPAIAPGKPDKSLLIEAINYESIEMPPDEKLSTEDIAALTTWVKMGAPWPDPPEKGAVRGRTEKISDEDRAYWAFQPVRNAAPPAVADPSWAGNPIDRFIFQRLAEEGLSPSPPVDRRALIRRLSFDLIGLPPTPDEIDEFVNDLSPNAYLNLVDKLLNSPRYGERWARHWLDLVRYAESDGFKQDGYRPQAYRYRDYVIRAFNSDKPYNQFVMEQLAGDELAPNDLDAIAATAYLRHWIYEYNQRDVRTQWSNILNDLTDVTAEVFLGVSVGCARCHDHKFDPILRKDYYRLQAFFAPLLPRDDVPFAEPETMRAYHQRFADWEQKTADLRRQISELERPIRDQVAAAAINKFPPDIRPMLSKNVEGRTPFEQQLADLAFRQVTEEYVKLDFAAKLKGEAKEKWQSIKKQLDAFEKERPEPPAPAFTVTDVGPVAPAVFIPGDRTKQEIQPGFLSVLDPTDIEIVSPYSNSTGRRTTLARWITRPDNPLAVRVIVNRVWQYHFGQGIVSTSSDFGRLGDAPSHPELLDWLAHWFVENGWSLKRLHRLIVTSSTYQQAAVVPTPDAARLKDPENRWLWHMPIRRLDAEQIRDAALAVSDELELAAGGPSVDTTRPRRTIFTKVIRNVRDPLMDVFDAPDNFNSTSSRNITTTPTQSLLMINGPWMLERAQAFADRLHRQTSTDEAAWTERAFELAYGRAPSESQRHSSIEFLNKAPAPIAVPSASPGFAMFPGRTGQALEISASQGLVPVLATGDRLDLGGEFTIEAVVFLRSLYEDAAVRTIASQWNSSQKHAGWSLGVTSTKSKHDPRNLILQFVGDAKDGPMYEVVPSNLRLGLNRPYYVAAVVRMADITDKGVTFFVRDLSDEDAPQQTASASHKVLTIPGISQPFVIGGRAGNERHRWDGLLDDVRVFRRALSADELGKKPESNSQEVAGMWAFEPESGVLHDSTSHHRDLTALPNPQPVAPSLPTALVDFCHVLLNSSEFLYVE